MLMGFVARMVQQFTEDDMIRAANATFYQTTPEGQAAKGLLVGVHGNVASAKVAGLGKSSTADCD
jgi:hypothetical protein